MLIYSSNIGERFRYACKMLLRNYNGEIQFTNDEQRLSAFTGPKIYYGESTDQPAIHIFKASEKIWDSGISPMNITIGKWEELHAVFIEAQTTFDVLAATFYMLTRYEEYGAIATDIHDRFESKNSTTGNSELLRQPIVDQWRMKFETLAKRQFPEVDFTRRQFSSEITIDVDSAFAFRHKGFYRTVGAAFKDVTSLRVRNLTERLSVIAHLKRDAYETYEYIIHVSSKKTVPLTWFFLLADFSREDINVPHTSAFFRKLIHRIASKYQVGIHPGYASNGNISKLTKEKGRLEEITGNEIVRSRQHYLKIRFPETYKRLISQNITDDYTMGYSDNVGFRAGTSLTFPWFDLVKNEETNLTIHPFVVMDTTLNKYLGLSPDEAIELCTQLKSVIEKTDGHFCILWHNETLSERGIWKGWRRVFEVLTS
jgi:hypothetical protein